MALPGTGESYKRETVNPASQGKKIIEKKGDALNRVENLTQGEIGGQESRLRDYIAQEQERIGQAGTIDQDYLSNTRQNWQAQTEQTQRDETAFQRAQQDARRVSEANMADATQTHGELKPMQRDAMDRAQAEASQAMSLQDYMDPNNKVAQGYRDLYNDEGQRLMDRYETQAQAAQKRGQADFGVLASLGAQAAAGQNFGPMTVGQQMANMAVANRQAGEAYANTQRRMQALRDMGMSGEDALRLQGLAAGERGSDKAYEAGRLSQEDLARRMGEYEGMTDRQIGRTTGISDRMVNLSGEVLGSQQRIGAQRFGGQQSLYDLERGIGQSDLMRESGLGQMSVSELGALSDKRISEYDRGLARRLGISAQSDALASARAARNAQMISAGLGAAGTIGGAMVGGPVGAAAGGAAGGAAGAAVAPQPQQPSVAPQPQPMPTNYGPQGYTSFQGGGYNPGYNYAPGYNYPVRPSVNPNY